MRVREKLISNSLRFIIVLGLTVCGSLIGLALALAVAPALGQSCPDSACQTGLYAFIGGVALTQGVNLIVLCALYRQLWRRKKRAAHDRAGSICYKR